LSGRVCVAGSVNYEWAGDLMKGASGHRIYERA
jgi:hypothetical protein